MSDVKALGYVGLTGSVEEWHRLAGILGLQAVPGSSPAEARFRVDERAWRIAVEEGGPSCEYIGWEVDGPAALNRLRDKLGAAKIPIDADPRRAAIRGVVESFSCHDPSGICQEFFYGPQFNTAPFVSPTGARFITSDGEATLGLGHVVLLVDDAKATAQFYMGLLGFELSDSWRAGFMEVTFTHVNGRHHSLAFGATGGRIKSGIGHFMLEVDSLDVIGRALDRVTEAGFPITHTLGKHSNDHMTSFYLATPSGCELEYGTGGRLIDSSWTPNWFDSPSMWGHKRQIAVSEMSTAGPARQNTGSLRP